MTSMRLGLATLVGVVLWLGGGAGCGTVRTPMEALMDRAAFDLRCAKSALSVTYADGDTRAVEGCGLQATYVFLCSGGSSCNWLLNGGPRGTTWEARK